MDRITKTLIDRDSKKKHSQIIIASLHKNIMGIIQQKKISKLVGKKKKGKVTKIYFTNSNQFAYDQQQKSLLNILSPNYLKRQKSDNTQNNSKCIRCMIGSTLSLIK